MTNRGYFLLPTLSLALFGCETNVDEAQAEARDAAVLSDEKIDAATAKAEKKNAEARHEAAEDIAKIQKDTKERIGEATTDAEATILAARTDALEKKADATHALRKASESTRVAVEKDLSDLEARVTRARENLKNEPVPSRAAKEQELTAISKATADLRVDLHSFETKTIQSVETFQSNLNTKMSDTSARLGRLEGNKASAL